MIASTLYDYIHTRRSEKLGPELNVNGFSHPPPPYSQFSNGGFRSYLVQMRLPYFDLAVGDAELECYLNQNVLTAS